MHVMPWYFLMFWIPYFLYNAPLKFKKAMVWKTSLGMSSQYTLRQKCFALFALIWNCTYILCKVKFSVYRNAYFKIWNNKGEWLK